MMKCLPVSRRESAGIFAVGILLSASSLEAAEWDISKSLGVSVQEVYSDNVDRVNEGAQSQFSTQAFLTPRISLTGKGARANVDLTGSLAYRAGDGTARSFTPRIDARGDAELVRNHLFLDATVNVTERVIDPFGDVTLDGVNDSGNSTISYQYSLSPSYKTRIGDLGTLTARYEFRGTTFSDDGGTDSSDNSFNVALDTDSDGSRFTWGVRTDYRKSNYSGDDERDFLATDVDLGFRFNRHWRMQGTLGREWNDYPSDENTIGGFRWTLNTTWTPTPRASLGIGYGGRYFGSTPTLDFTYKHRKSSMALSYSRVVTDSNRQLATLETDPVTGQIFPVSVLSNDVFVDQRLTASYTLTGKRSTLNLSATNSKQESQSGLQESELSKLGMSVSRSLSNRISGNASVNWYQQDRADDDSAQTWQGTLGFSVNLGQRTSLNANYLYNKRDGDQASENYVENRVTLSLNYTL